MRGPQNQSSLSSCLPSRTTQPRPWAAGSVFSGMMLLAGLAAGCQPHPLGGQPGQRLTAAQLANMPLEKNVTGVAAFYAPYSPWIWNDDRSKVIGIVINPLYLVGPDSLGVFGDGVIEPRIYVLEGPPGSDVKTPRLVKEWFFDPQQALQWRAKKRTVWGWGYVLWLIWGDELDLAGKEIRITVSFERSDGKVFHSGKKDYLVPARGGR